jgi:hypothetical protein
MRVREAYSLHDLIVCVIREVELRKRVYSKLLAAGKMKPEKAAWEIGCMQEIAERLKSLPGDTTVN